MAWQSCFRSEVCSLPPSADTYLKQLCYLQAPVVHEYVSVACVSALYLWNHICLFQKKSLSTCFELLTRACATRLKIWFSPHKTPLKMFMGLSLKVAVNSVQWNHTCCSFFFFFSEIPMWKNTSAGKKECNCRWENSRWFHLSSRWMSMASESSEAFY